MTEMLHNYGWLRNVLDIFVVTIIIYRLLLLLKGTTAARLTVFLSLLFICHLFSRYAGFQTVYWLLDNLLGSLILVLIIIFQHDIRRALLSMSNFRFSKRNVQEKTGEIIEELVMASESLVSRKIGALIVIERETPLDHFLAVGTEIDAKVTSEIISSIFLPYSPIHDGAVIIQKGKLTRAGCFLPLTQNPEVSKTLGTRHRAAIGLAEVSDAVVIVVSEENSKISVAIGGRITRDLEPGTLRKVLTRLLEQRWRQ
ncbi:MAG: diadenylate cyclase CdaA [Geobacteraceae bacterium]